MVLMRVRNDDPEQRWIGLLEARDGVKRHVIRVGYIQWNTHIDHDPLAVRFDLDAGAADFFSAAMNADPHNLMPFPYQGRFPASIDRRKRSAGSDQKRCLILPKALGKGRCHGWAAAHGLFAVNYNSPKA